MVQQVLEKFNIEGELINVETSIGGYINNTYVVSFKDEFGNVKKYLVQKINTTVFAEPYKLMKNIEGITTYLKKQLEKENDKKHQVLEIVKTIDGKSMCYIENNGERNYFRIYEFIENAITYDFSVDKKVVYNTGKAFGHFQKLLKDYPIESLNETITDFHITDKRYKKLLDDIKIDSKGRVMEVTKEIVFILTREKICSLISDRLGTDDVPYRVTHNDTKVDNVLMHKDTGDYMSVIDLDTVMPGSLLFDYGDGIRSTASAARDDETDLSKVHINLDFFEAYTEGYLSEIAPYMTKTEASLMAESIRVITLELAIRFLNDYINGDTYFKINYEKHNLDRARAQIALVKDIEKQLDYMNNFILQSYNKYKGNEKTMLLKK